MGSRIVTWKGVDIAISEDGKAVAFGGLGIFCRTEYSSLREAFREINATHKPPSWELSTWDNIKQFEEEFSLGRGV